MSSPVLDRKIDVSLRYLDQNDTGTVRREDLLRIGRRLLATFRQTETSARGAPLLAGIERFWAALAATCNANGQLSTVQYRAALASVLAGCDGFTHAFGPMAEAFCRLLDADGDGTISRQEFRMAQQALHTTPGNADVAFARLDRNADGQLSVDELLHAIHEYYTSTDPDAPGNWLFGAAFTTATR